MSLTKREIVQTMVKKHKLEVRQADEMLNWFLNQIKTCIQSGESAKLSGFGSFKVSEKAARMGRNPKTGERLLLPARRVVVFHPASDLKNRVKPLTAGGA
jgi:integration host factor subunit alpha